MAELLAIIKSCMQEIGLEFTDQDMESLRVIWFDGLDDINEELSFDTFLQLINQSQGLLENVAASVEHWLLPSLPEKCLKKARFTHKLSTSYIKNNLPSFLFYVCIFAVNAALIYQRCHQYWEEHYWVIIARCAGQSLNFASSFTLVLMLRKSFTLLRSLGAASYLPLDNNVYYHMIIGYVITGYAVIHSVAHVFNYRKCFTTL